MQLPFYSLFYSRKSKISSVKITRECVIFIENNKFLPYIEEKIIFAYIKTSRESHFHLQVIAHVRLRIIFSMHRISIRNTVFCFVSKPR